MTRMKALAAALAAAALLASPAGLFAAQGQVNPQNTDVTPQPNAEETLHISAPRERRIHEARFPGSPNRGNPMRQFPGELPEKNAYSTPFDLEGYFLEDARQSQALPTIQGRPATPDTLNR